MAKKIYKGFFKALDAFDSVSSIIFISLMVICIFLQILFRYVIADALTWSEELARYAMIYVVYIGVGVGTKLDTHMGVDVFTSMLPQLPRKIVWWLAQLLTFGIYAFCLYYTISFMKGAFSHMQLSPAMRMPMWIVYLGLPVGFASGCFRVLQKMLDPIVLSEKHAGSPQLGDAGCGGEVK